MDVGEPIPDVAVHDAAGAALSLAALPRPLVLYFYPKDDTAGCTREAQDFSALAADFAAAGVTVLGISKDSPQRHARFAAKYELTVPLASDENGAAIAAFGIWVEKSLYGRKYMGVERSTFLFDGKGKLASVWRKVWVPGHAAAVLAAVRTL